MREIDAAVVLFYLPQRIIVDCIFVLLFEDPLTNVFIVYFYLKF